MIRAQIAKSLVPKIKSSFSTASAISAIHRCPCFCSWIKNIISNSALCKAKWRSLFYPESGRKLRKTMKASSFGEKAKSLQDLKPSLKFQKNWDGHGNFGRFFKFSPNPFWISFTAWWLETATVFLEKKTLVGS